MLYAEIAPHKATLAFLFKRPRIMSRISPQRFENDVDVTHGAEVLLERRALVIEHRFDAEVLPQERALGRAAGDGNDPAAVNLGELTSL